MDTVFSKWKGRNYIRARVVPANPNTAAQQAVRNSLARCVELWQSFEQQIQDAWDTYASPYQMSGFNKFMSKNRADEQAGNELETSPENADIDPVTSFAAATGGASGEIDLTWNGGTQGANYKAYVLVRKSGEDVFSVGEKDTTLISAGLLTLTGLAAGTSYQVYLSDEETALDEFSLSQSDTATSGA